ncbi:craniofacial development protein 2-like [Melanaphis sacchari]|uniref:craniofacial development protein 2-like n=1 Tax=Melanaphis sacchari TaxID=742174 RepID=UPI000DC1366D|nr:craniofacial development protein 2-like [Melanaphis sacchari]
MKCVALQEVRLEDASTTKISQTERVNEITKLGTGFAIHESIIHMIKEFKDVNPRISTLTLKDKNLHIVLINVHAPMEEKFEEIKEEFYDTLEEVFDTTVGNIKIVLGNLNAKIRKERIYYNVAEKHNLHEHSNDNSSRLANFASGKGLIIKSTMLPCKDIYKYTWVSPDGRHKNQIDHVLINNRFKNSITNVRTLRGADADSDHFLKLEEVNIQKDYGRKICETLKVQQITNTDDVNNVWIKIRNTVQQTAKTTIGIMEKRKKPWFNLCEDAVQRRKIARVEWMKDTNNKERTADFRC